MVLIGIDSPHVALVLRDPGSKAFVKKCERPFICARRAIYVLYIACAVPSGTALCTDNKR